MRPVWSGPASVAAGLQTKGLAADEEKGEDMRFPGNMQSMLKQAQQMQQRLREEIAQISVEASAGGGMVTVRMNGEKNVLGVKIDPEVAGDVEMLQDLVLAACNEACKKVDEAIQEKTSGLLGGLGLPPGLF